MKLACTQENLQKGLNIVGRMVSKNSTLPVLGNILLKTEKGGLRLTATDLEVGVSCLVGGKIDLEGQITIPARLINDYVNQLPKERLSLSLEDSELQLACEDTSAKIKGISAEEFPLLPTVESDFQVDIPAAELKMAIDQVIFAAANDESRPELAGVFMKFTPSGCILAATDSFRLAEKKINCSGATEEKVVIVPAKTLSELARIIDIVDKNNVRVVVSDNQILFSYETVSLVSRLIEGQYPPYQDVIPKDLTTSATIHREDFIQAVRAGGLFSKSGAQDVKIAVKPDQKSIAIHAEANQVGGHEQSIKADISGPQDMVVFNYRYLLEGLQAFGVNQITFETGGSASPGKIINPEDPSYVYILMPIKL